jgi:hypothetical protein
MQKCLEKYVPKLPWLKFKYGHPWKTIQSDNIFGPPIVAFPLNNIMFVHQINRLPSEALLSSNLMNI